MVDMCQHCDLLCIITDYIIIITKHPYIHLCHLFLLSTTCIYIDSKIVIPNMERMPHWWMQFTKGGIMILEMPRWGMAQNRLGTTLFIYLTYRLANRIYFNLIYWYVALLSLRKV